MSSFSLPAGILSRDLVRFSTSVFVYRLPVSRFFGSFLSGEGLTDSILSLVSPAFNRYVAPPTCGVVFQI